MTEEEQRPVIFGRPEDLSQGPPLPPGPTASDALADLRKAKEAAVQVGVAELAPPVRLVPDPPARDPRIPDPGTVLERTHEGKLWRVLVLNEGFKVFGEEKIHRSISGVAKRIVGRNIDGYWWFGLKGGSRPAEPAPQPLLEQIGDLIAASEHDAIVALMKIATSEGAANGDRVAAARAVLDHCRAKRT